MDKAHEGKALKVRETNPNMHAVYRRSYPIQEMPQSVRTACSAPLRRSPTSLTPAPPPPPPPPPQDICTLPPSALQGLADRADELLGTLKIKSVKYLANFKYYKVAKAIVALAAVEEAGGRRLQHQRHSEVCL